MQSVSDRWYFLYSRLLAALAAVLLIGSLVTQLVPSLQATGQDWGLTYITAGVAALLLLYFGLLYKWHVRKSGPWQPTLVLSMIQALLIINLLQSTGGFHSWYMTLWGLTVLASGMFGSIAILGTGFLVTLYFVMVYSGTDQTNLDLYAIGGVIGTCLLGVVSYIIWRAHFTERESGALAHMSGLLKSKQQQSEILIQSIADGVMVVNTEGKIGLINKAAADLTQWNSSDALGIDVRSVMKLAHEDGRPLEQIEEPFSLVLSKQEQVNKTLVLVGQKDKKSTISLVISPISLPKTKELVGAVAVFRDISQARKAESQRAEFISTASHEMRTPVAAIEGYLALALNDKVSRIDTKAREYLEKAHSSTQHLGKLFQDLLTSAKAEDGRLSNYPVVVEMGVFLEQLVDSLRFAAEKKGLRLEFVVGSHQGTVDASTGSTDKSIRPLYYTHVDPDRIQEVITNLFDNAVKYTDEGKIALSLTGDPEVVQIQISDTGAGIPAEDVPHLFQKFYRVDNSATRTVGGTGLGLFISRKIIELYNGRIWVESQVGKGSTFFINLPRLDAKVASEQQAKEAAESPLTDVMPLKTSVLQ